MKNSAYQSHSFMNAPSANISRSSFDLSKRTMTTFDSADLVPIYLEEVLPGDTWNLQTNSVVRLATPLYPVMDNIYMDIHYFFVPKRLVWTNFNKFHGEEVNPGDSNDYLIPKLDTSGTPTLAEDTIFDYMGLPTKVATHADTRISALPLRCYNLIYNEYYRDENLIDSITVNLDDGPDATTDYAIKKRGKRHDIFTSCLPAPYKSDDGAVTLPLGTDAPITGIGKTNTTFAGATGNHYETDSTGTTVSYASFADVSDNTIRFEEDPNNAGYLNIRADLSSATASTVDSLIEAFAIQDIYRIDARSGTRIHEVVLAHFNVFSPSLTMQARPEFLGGGTSYVNFHTVANTSATATEDQGDLSAYGTCGGSDHAFTKSLTEWGFIIGIASARADLTYQQGLDRIWTRAERLDFYLPGLANLGEEAIENQEIYFQGTASTGADTSAFGYQERWGHYRYGINKITGQFRSNHTTPLDAWHLGQEFASLPTLNQTFIEEAPPISRVVADATAPEFIGDFYFNVTCARAMPLYSVPGMKAIL